MTGPHDQASDDAELIDGAPCALIVTDAEDGMLRINRTFLRWTGYREDDLLGATFASLLDIGGQAFYATQLQDGLWTEAGVDGISLTLRRADGTMLPVLMSARVIEGTVRTVQLALFDATSRQQLELDMLSARRSAEESVDGIRMLQAAATRFLVADDEVQLARQLSETLREAFSAADSAVALYDGDGTTFRLVEGEHLMPLLESVRASRVDDRRALAVEEMITIQDIEEGFARSTQVGENLRAVRSASYIGVPFSDGERVIGAFAAVFGRPRTFDPATRELYRALARQTGLAFSRVRLVQRMRDLATRDHLTGLANRSTIDDRLAEAIDAGRADATPVALIFLDLDGFKQINDTAGHRTGDVVLRLAAGRLLAHVRDTDVVGRFGGDEFVIICRDTDLDAAMQIAERAAAAIAEPLGGALSATGITASIGIALYDPSTAATENVASLTRRADAAMYASKRAGRNRITTATR